jgi:polyisoprenoid-binding protein YceI
MLTKVVGSFNQFEGTLQWDPDSPSRCSASASIHVASIDTGDASRDRHLTGPDFFDVEHHPLISFTSKRFVFSTKSNFVVEGDLSMHGTIRPVTLQCSNLRVSKDAAGETRLELASSTRIRRKDFGLRWNAAIEAGGVMVGDDIEIELKLEFTREA